MLDTYRRNEQQTQEDFFIKYLPLTLFVRVQKGYSGVLLWGGAGDEHKL